MSETAPIRVLYVEDDRDLAELVKHRLGKVGYTVEIANDGEDGLAKSDAGAYDLVALDHSLPVRDGLEVIGVMAARGPLPPTIMITGSGDEKTAVETMKRGADDYIIKDIAGGWLDLLPEVIERVLAQRRIVREKEQVEQQLRESERRRAEAEKLAAVSRIAARVAHEINNPLAGVKSAFQLVKGAVPDGHPDLEFAAVVEKEIDRIATIVSRMYKLYPAGDKKVDDVCVGDLVSEVLMLIQPIASENQVELAPSSCSVDTTVRIPEGDVRQVLYNLLINAIESSPPQGVVRVDVGEGDNAIEIRVIDQGASIPAELRDRIFEPFFTTKDRETTGGLGLGLSISKGIVESLHGSLDFESEPGKGTVFRIVLPLRGPK